MKHRLYMGDGDSFFDAPPSENFDHEKAVKAKKRGIRKAERNADTRVLEQIERCVVLCSKNKDDFTQDDVEKMFPEIEGTLNEPRAIGSVFQRLARKGAIVPTDAYRPGNNVRCHNRPKRVWKRA